MATTEDLQSGMVDVDFLFKIIGKATVELEIYKVKQEQFNAQIKTLNSKLTKTENKLKEALKPIK